MFNIGKEYRAQSDSDSDSKTVYLDDISVLRNLFILCHEIGHAVNSERYTDEERRNINQSIDACEHARLTGIPIGKNHLNRVLKSERNAWATALKIITRLLIKGRLLSGADVYDSVHRRNDGGLGSYSLGISGFAKRGSIVDD